MLEYIHHITIKMAGLVAYESSDEESDVGEQVQESKVCSIALIPTLERSLTW